jgi:hypothetical protein
MTKAILLMFLCLFSFITVAQDPQSWSSPLIYYSGSMNPSVSGWNAPKGTFFFGGGGLVFVKSDDGLSTNWIGITGSAGGVTDVTGTSPILSSGGATPDISCNVASGSQAGCLSSTDWTTFNNKQTAGSYVLASRLINTTSPLTGGGDLSADRTIAIPAATNSVNGYLTSTDWTTFNGKQAAGNYITALTSDVTASGPGSVVATVASVGGSSAANVHTSQLNVSAGPSKILWVNQSHPGTYTPDGSVLRPFITIGAATSQVIANNDGASYVIYISPGTYSESITLNNAAFTRIAFIGSSNTDGGMSNNAIPITSLTGDITSTSNNDTLKALIVRGLDMQGNINLTGDITGTHFCQYGCVFSDMIIYSTGAPAITLNNVGQVMIRDTGTAISSGAGAVSVTNVSFFGVYSTFLNLGAFTLVTNNGANKPTGFGGTSVQTSFGNLIGATTVDAGSTFVQRYERMSSTISNSGAMTSVGSTYLGIVTQNSGATWSSSGDSFTALPVFTAITPTFGTYRFEKSHMLNGAANVTNGVLMFKDGHIVSTMTTAPTATVNGNAGTGATCSLSNATDSAGTISLTTTATSPASGAQCAINFNKTYNVAPVCVFTSGNANSAQLAVSSGVYSTTSTSALTVNFAVTDAIGHAYSWQFKCIETQ